jgi:alkyldihydroxyacetonephosphate synthase
VSLLELDGLSLLVHVNASVSFASVEAALRLEGLTLDAGDYGGTVGEWLAEGAPGARSAWLDPADHVVAGFSARASGRPPFALCPAPRRAVGPDLLSLVLGMRGRLLTLESVWLRVQRTGAPRPTCEAFQDDNEELTDDERSLYALIEDALRQP